MKAEHGFPPEVREQVERAISSQLAPAGVKADQALAVVWAHLQAESNQPPQTLPSERAD